MKQCLQVHGKLLLTYISTVLLFLLVISPVPAVNHENKEKRVTSSRVNSFIVWEIYIRGYTKSMLTLQNVDLIQLKE